MASKLSVTIRPYSELSFILYGEDSREIKDGIMSCGGRWNPNLKHPLYEGQKLKGYIFANKRKEELIKFLNSKNVSIANVGGGSVKEAIKKEVKIDPNRPKTDRYTGKKVKFQLYKDHYIIVYGDITDEMGQDLKELGFEKNTKLQDSGSNSTFEGYKANKIKRSGLIDFCIMQDVDYDEVK
jgi:hypothetical protein